MHTQRWSDHSQQHGHNLGSQLLLRIFRRRDGDAGVSAGVSAAAPPSKGQALQCIQNVIVRESPVMEAYDVSQGPNWHDGLGRSIPADAMSSQTVSLIREEAEQHSLRITGVQADKGRGLETISSRSDGDTVCVASALFWDDWDALVAWVELPGNNRFCDRIVQIDKVKSWVRKYPFGLSWLVWPSLLSILLGFGRGPTASWSSTQPKVSITVALGRQASLQPP